MHFFHAVAQKKFFPNRLIIIPVGLKKNLKTAILHVFPVILVWQNFIILRSIYNNTIHSMQKSINPAC